MKIVYVFSSNKKLGSRLISWASSYFDSGVRNAYKSTPVPSHVAVILDDTFVVESTLSSGVRVIPLSSWLAKNTVLHSTQSTSNINKVSSALLSVWGAEYDWLGILYFACKFLIPGLPKENKWQNSRKYFCTEFAARLSGTKPDVTPARLYMELSGWNG